VLNTIIDRLMELNRKPRLSQVENDDEEQPERLKHRISNFVQDFDEGKHWTKTRDGGTVKFEPVFIGRFIDRFLWQQSEKVLLSSATIPKGDFLDAVGLGEKRVAHVEVPSTFPTKRRPVITKQMVGKMTKDERDDTIPTLADELAEISEFHRGERGFVHCNSYDIMQRIYEHLPRSVKERTMRQDQDNRMTSLEDWYDSDEQIFLSVAMDEGISLDDDRARWQVVAKASYPFMGDERVNYRVNEMGDWDWYANQAIIDLQQAVGRGMRSKDDYCVTYLLDSSFRNLLNKNEHLFEPWFLDSIDCFTDLDVYGKPETNFTFSG
jgi:Rad3-related DNA helicase